MSAMTAREFNRDVSAAKRAALKEPVMITDRGNPAFVLVSIEEYRKLRGEDTGQNLLDRLSMDDDIDFEPTPLRLVPKDAEL